MRRAIVTRVVICLVAGVLAAGLFSEITFRLGNNVSRPPQQVELVIPQGAAEKTAQGESVVPDGMVLVVGDTLVVRNEDVTPHTLGPLYIPPGSSASLTLDQPENQTVVCSFRPTKTFGLDVREALTLDTRVTGILLAGLPLGILLALYSLVAWPLKKAESRQPPG